MAFTPLHDRVLVRRTEGDEKTSGGLIIPDSAKKNQLKVRLYLAAKAPVKTPGN